ncbi:phage tail tape measure protein [Microbacterium sp. 77mftsu3.1]|uniref:phage tail tape measure protein n=1 Tax=Microbacterium sp. 77mftsu3.1 TaxID=1761802 RepID=UPI000373DAD6|nr:phage tail tape measure protein [Microbacterium sp. 77mftsu3.1]
MGVSLSAQVNDWNQAFATAQKSVRDTGSEVERLSQKKQEFELLGRGMLVAGGVMAAGVGLAIGKFVEFDQAMSNVIATGDDATENQVALRDAAIEAGAATVFSATESANAIEEMAKAGLSAKDILGGGLTGSLDLAAAGGLGVARSAEVMSTTLQQFKLDGTDASHVADLLAAGAGKAMGDVEDMAQALNQAGLVAHQFQVPVEETVGTLSAFASAGMLGSDAGTSLRTMLLRLANPTKENAQLMESLGINAYDSTGKFIGLAGLAGELETAFAGMTEEQKQSNLAMIFGQDAIRGASILLQEGKGGIQEYTRMVDDQGYAAETAAKRLDNLKGDVEGLSGAIDTGLIQMGESANGPGRFFVQFLTGLVDGFNEMPDAGQSAVFWIGAAGAAVSIAGGLFFTAVPKIAEFRSALDGMPPGVQRLSRGLSTLGGLLGAFAVAGAAVAGLEAIGGALRGVEADATELQNTLTKGSLDKALAQSVEGTSFPWEVERVKETLQDLGGVLDQIRQGAPSSNSDDPIDIYFDQLSASVTNLGDALAGVSPDELVGALAAIREQYDLTDEDILTLINSSSDLRNALIQQADVAGLAADDNVLLDIALGKIKPSADEASAGALDNAAALQELEGAAQGTGTEVDKLADQIRGFGSVELDSRAAAREFEQALDDLTESAKKNGSTLDNTTQKGRDNEAAIDSAAKSALDYAAATAIRTGSEEDAAKVLAEGRRRVIDMLGAFNITGDAAEDYADDLGLIPKNIGTAVTLNGWEAAMDNAREVAQAIRDIPGRRDVVINQMVKQTGAARGEVAAAYNANGGLYDYKAFANGGFEPGIYAGRAAGIHKFAEPETVWEAYVSGKPDQRERNIAIAENALMRLGAQRGSSERAPIHVDNRGATYYSYDPTQVSKENALALQRAMDASF